ncbi:protein mono-ADP-ribosyltransferase PARP12-like [Centroberyx gerrardi]
MTESAVMKFVCANQGSINTDELVFSGCFGDFRDVREIISNREKFAWCSSGGQQKVVAKTEVRLCKAKDCQGCSSLHLCKRFLLGSCPVDLMSKGCHFPHDLKSEHNVTILREHELEDLNRTELCTLLLQNDNYFLPPICYDYNNGDGPYGRCPDGDRCTRLHICERHLRQDCFCPRAHDFYDLQPLKALQDRGVPPQLLRSMKSIYMNKEALKSRDNKGNRGNKGNHQLQQRACSASDILAAVNSDDGPNRRQRQRPKDKTEKCQFFIRGHCKHGDRCFKAHDMPHRRQVSQVTEEMEKDCDPEKTCRCREMEQEVATLQAQLVEKQTENDRLKLRLDSMQEQSQAEERKAGEDGNNLAQLKDAYTKLFEDYNKLKEEKKKKAQLVQREVVEELQGRLAAAEQALATKQEQIDTMKEKELETISVFQAQAEVYSSDFYAERAAREKTHAQNERLAAQLEFVKKQNNQLQKEMDSLGRQSLNEMQRRHESPGRNPPGGAAAPGGRGADSQQQQGILPEHTCPMCNEILPDLDSLQIHIMDCII